jgi:hypothetical protein
MCDKIVTVLHHKSWTRCENNRDNDVGMLNDDFRENKNKNNG